MQFSIDKDRLADFRSRFKVAVATTNDHFEKVRKADLEVDEATAVVSRIKQESRVSRQQQEIARGKLSEAEAEYDKVYERYVEASRLSGYYGNLYGRCQEYADKCARSEGEAKRSKLEDDVVDASHAAHVERLKKDFDERGAK